jgi:mycothiol system anti-sigma-R factor
MTTARIIDCEEALRHLFDYMDAELADEQRREMENHLEQCRSCYSRIEFERRLKSHLAELGRADVPPALAQRVRSLIDQFIC